jgi:hypothetical protein
MDYYSSKFQKQWFWLKNWINLNSTFWNNALQKDWKILHKIQTQNKILGKHTLDLSLFVKVSIKL